jgi:hypothetical protein
VIPRDRVDELDFLKRSAEFAGVDEGAAAEALILPALEMLETLAGVEQDGDLLAYLREALAGVERAAVNVLAAAMCARRLTQLASDGVASGEAASDADIDYVDRALEASVAAARHAMMSHRVAFALRAASAGPG